MNFSRGTLTIAALAGAASLALAPTATAATTYQITVIPPIGTVRANNLVTLARWSPPPRRGRTDPPRSSWNSPTPPAT